MANLMINEVRLSFPTLWEPKGFEGGKPAYSVSGILSKDHPDIQKIHDAIDAAGQAKWKTKWADMKELLIKQDKLPIHDGLNKAHLDGYEGNFYISARSYNRPRVVDQQRNPLTEEDGKPYAGCWANLAVEFYAQDNAYGKRINCNLRGVQFVRDGDSFGGSVAMNDEEFELLDVANFI